MSALISASELNRLVDSGSPVRILDVRWQLGIENGYEDYLSGHIPGAVYVDLDSELADPPTPADGRHPLPGIERFQAAVERWGIEGGDPVVVYDAVGGTAAARAWWLLRHAGHRNVRVLDGALRAWLDLGYPLETADVVPKSGSFSISFGSLATVNLDDIQDVVRRGVLIDARAAERYTGAVEPIDPRPGHIPGAISVPTGNNLGSNQRFLAPGAIREKYEALGISNGSQLAVYCGSGITATHSILALSLAGFDAALYPGSWSQWAARDHLPAELTPHP